MQGEKFVVLKQRLICSFFIFANNETAGKNKALLLYIKEPKKKFIIFFKTDIEIFFFLNCQNKNTVRHLTRL